MNEQEMLEMIEKSIDDAQKKDEERRAAMTPEEREADDREREQKNREFDHKYRVEMAMPKDLPISLDARGHELWRLAHDLKLNEREHWEQEDSDRDRQRIRLSRFRHMFDRANLSDADKDRLVEAYKTNTPLTEPISIRDDRFSYLDGCHYCAGGWDLLTDGWKIWPSDECPHPFGVTVTVEMDVPSGKILVANDLRPWFHSEDFDVNTAHGIVNVVKSAAENGWLHFYVGNTCPGVYKQDDGSFTIANPPAEDSEAWDDKDENRRVAGVITDLWWVSMADYDAAVANGWEARGHWCNEDVIEVEPGTYVLTYHGTERAFERDNYNAWTVWAELKRKD